MWILHRIKNQKKKKQKQKQKRQNKTKQKTKKQKQKTKNKNKKTNKQNKASWKSMEKKLELLSLIHSELGNLKNTMTRGGKRFSITFIVDYSIPFWETQMKQELFSSNKI